MAKTSAPMGFWRFVIISSVILAVLRNLLFPGGRGDLAKPFWLSVFLWAGYRVARLQPWWPFPLGGRRVSKAEYQQVIVPPSSQEPAPREAKFTKPLTADDLRIDFRRQAAKAVKVVRQTVKVPAIPAYMPPPEVLGLSNDFSSGLSRTSASSPSKFFSASTAPVSSVGLRSKVSRSKTVRHRTTRRKRRS